MKKFFKLTKRFFSRPIVLGLVPFLSASCTTAQHVVTRIDPNYYVGKSHQYVVSMLGATNGEFSDGADGYILSYEGNQQIFSYSRKYSRNSSTLPTLQLHFNNDGYCTDANVVNAQPVRAVNAWWTVALVLGILIIL